MRNDDDDFGLNGFGGTIPLSAYEDDEARQDLGAGANDPADAAQNEAARKEALLSRLVSAAEPDGSLATPYVIKDVIYQKAPGLIFAPSRAAKTAVMIDMARSITTGTDYYGKRTDPGCVIMLAVEDADGIPPRVEAEARRLPKHEAELFRSRYRRFKDPGLWLKGKDGDKAVDEVIEVANLYSELTGLPCRMIQIDTKPKIHAGESVNDDDTATCFIMRCQRVAEATGACVLASAHPGYGTKMRASGSVQNDGSFYSIIRVDIDQADPNKIQNTDRRTIHLVKVKGRPSDYALGQYTLSTVDIGTDDDGDPIDAVVLDRSESINLTAKCQTRSGPSGQAARVEETLSMLYDQGRDFTATGTEIGIHDAPSNDLWRVVDEAEFRSFCRERLISEDGINGTSKEISDRESLAFGRAIKALDTKFHRVGRSGGLIWSVAANKRRADTQPRERPKPKTYRKPGALSDTGDEPTQPTPADIVGSVGSG